MARRVLLLVALGFLAVFLVLPLVAVFAQALRGGLGTWRAAISSPDALDAIELTLLVTLVCVPVNAAFGVAAAWLIAKFRFRGRSLMTALLDLPLGISPVVAGLVFVLLFGRTGWLGPWLASHDLRVIFALPGILLATMLVTFPFVAREVLAVMEAQGSSEEEAALTLGASGWQTFVRVTLPKVRWGLVYGIVLCTARAMGEFGAVSVVSGHVRGETNTVPLHVEILYNEYQFQAAFAVASLLTLLALGTLVVKQWVERRARA
jgi:sulfate/thiosulfate transport system permease protein